jgi:hypothetical protein
MRKKNTYSHVDEVSNQSILIHKNSECFEIVAEKFVPHFEGEDCDMNWER